jgi:hypothetical protein
MPDRLAVLQIGSVVLGRWAPRLGDARPDHLVIRLRGGPAAGLVFRVDSHGYQARHLPQGFARPGCSVSAIMTF